MTSSEWLDATATPGHANAKMASSETNATDAKMNIGALNLETDALLAIVPLLHNRNSVMTPPVNVNACQV